MRRSKSLMVVVLVLSLGLVMSVQPVSAFSGSGSGTLEDPYIITNVAQLQEMRNNLSAHYALGNDIDASDTVNWNSPFGFEPIGTWWAWVGDRFTGSLNGRGHTISGLFINRSGTQVVGLFGGVSSGGVVENVGLEDAYVRGHTYVGGLVGRSAGTVSNCYLTGSVRGTDEVGGIVGRNHGTVSNSYSLGSVRSGSFVGGLVGMNWGTVSNSYSTGTVTGDWYWIGGLVGLNYGGTVTNSFWDIETSGQTSSSGGTGKTTEEMQTITTFSSAGWDIGTTTLGNPTEGYPFLSWQVGHSPTWVLYEEPTTECIDTFTDTGLACLTPSKGTMVDLQAVAPVSPAPSGVNFPHGMFEFKITGLAEGATVTLTIELPQAVPAGFVWWKHDGTRWYSLPNLEDNGDNIMVIELTDGGPGDTPGSPDGEIHDPGGPGNPSTTVGWEGSSVDKAAIMAPWIALLAAIAGATLLILRRRRQTQS